MKVIIDPRSRMCYSGYYIKGFETMFGEKSIKYSIAPFKELDRLTDRVSYDKYMPVVLVGDSLNIKVIIDFWDLNGISQKAYDWCDVYAKINISKDQDLEKYNKLLSIPPGFGIKHKTTLGLAWFGIQNFFRCHFRPIASLKGFVFDYYAENTYAPLETYFSENVENTNYVFHASTLWPHTNCVNFTNPLRLSFMKACKSNPNLKFEGGFFIKGEAPEEYNEFAYHRFIKKNIYMQKIHESAIVFNTPAVHACHGWKLGEYLAMGKAIISTPISNLLPASLNNMEHLYIVNTPEEMTQAVNALMKDDNLMQFLKKNCKKYYNDYASPIAVVQSILKFYNQRYATTNPIP